MCCVQFDIGLVVVGGVMSPSLWEQCLATRVIVLCGVGHQQREAIVAMNGCKSSYYLQHLTQVGVAMTLAGAYLVSGL